MIEIATTYADSRIYTSEFLTNYLPNAILLVWGNAETFELRYYNDDLIIGGSGSSVTISKFRVWGIK